MYKCKNMYVMLLSASPVFRPFLIVSMWLASGISPGYSEHATATAGIWYLAFFLHLSPVSSPSLSDKNNSPPLSFSSSLMVCIISVQAHSLLSCVNWHLVSFPHSSHKMLRDRPEGMYCMCVFIWWDSECMCMWTTIGIQVCGNSPMSFSDSVA